MFANYHYLALLTIISIANRGKFRETIREDLVPKSSDFLSPRLTDEFLKVLYHEHIPLCQRVKGEFLRAMQITSDFSVKLE